VPPPSSAPPLTLSWSSSLAHHGQAIHWTHHEIIVKVGLDTSRVLVTAWWFWCWMFIAVAVACFMLENGNELRLRSWFYLDRCI
jgi:hypothetical protein